MKIKIVFVGKTQKEYLVQGEIEYLNRLKHYLKIEIITVPDLKNAKSLSFQEIKEREGELILKNLNQSEEVFLLDEKGRQFDSIGLSNFLQKQFNRGGFSMVFIIGGPYGFSNQIYERAQGLISLSNLTFSHQMIRLFFLEQIYRSMTILKGEPYHHK